MNNPYAGTDLAARWQLEQQNRCTVVVGIGRPVADGKRVETYCAMPLPCRVHEAGIPMLPLTPEVLEAIQSLLGDPSECRNAFIPCNCLDLCGGCKRAEKVRAAIAAAQKASKPE
jgi:hypothetical protein